MTTHQTGTREEWLAARLKLLAAEKEHTHRSDELALQRQALPWVRVDKDYRFVTEQGDATLSDLFDGRTQLMVYHFMYGPDYTAGCPSCSSIADGFNGIAVHLANHDITLTAVSRAPLLKLLAYRKRMGWTFPWASAHGGEFNYDYNAAFTEQQQQQLGIEYNYQREEPTGQPRLSKSMPAWDQPDGLSPVAQIAAGVGTDVPTFTRERPGVSTFIKENGVIYHTYSAYARGLDGLWGMYQWLDRAPLGRNENSVWWRRHDEYAAA
ncbi:putative dithiol-disulfide oxidoreductase (DUF899 family) [Silvimonas terrae]|uniref:Putative dithiol-disulfide oxidoreductase (DUF899 family) n=1 Tax=Silvimonas terrae TaxID=300266 RepID=A0A840RGU8_9NEIS|nr:DUF899 domain-containing protein [Silvimonas terrae]MBB5192277.1 putative dithiol-disulfide oxidoreductase (DUF899 family) [Silvimonas terrae]